MEEQRDKGHSSRRFCQCNGGKESKNSWGKKNQIGGNETKSENEESPNEPTKSNNKKKEERKETEVERREKRRRHEMR